MEDQVEYIAYTWIQTSNVIVNANVVDHKYMENACLIFCIFSFSLSLLTAININKGQEMTK